MTFTRFIALTTLLVGCSRQAERPVSTPEPNPSAASSVDPLPIARLGDEARQPGSENEHAPFGAGARLELRHFYRFAPGGGASLVVTECDLPACQKEVETASGK